MTDFQDFAGHKSPEEGDTTPNDDKSDAKKKAATPADKKKTPKDGMDDTGTLDFPAADPNDPNKNKVTPDCAHIQMSGIQTMSEMLNYFVHAANLDEDQQFTLVVDDC